MVKHLSRTMETTGAIFRWSLLGRLAGNRGEEMPIHNWPSGIHGDAAYVMNPRPNPTQPQCITPCNQPVVAVMKKVTTMPLCGGRCCVPLACEILARGCTRARYRRWYECRRSDHSNHTDKSRCDFGNYPHLCARNDQQSKGKHTRSRHNERGHGSTEGPHGSLGHFAASPAYLRR